MPATPIYLPRGTAELRQGEVVTGLLTSSLTAESTIQYLSSGRLTDNTISVVQIEYSVVLTQDCDLEQDFRLREEGASTETLLRNILFCQATPAEDFHEDPALKSREIRKYFAQNKLERYQYLAEVDSSIDSQGQGIAALGLDFKRYFTIPTELVYVQLKSAAVRRARLNTPFAEHLSDRFFAYQSRIALPVQHRRREPDVKSGLAEPLPDFAPKDRKV